MKWNKLQVLVEALLAGDTVFVNDHHKRLALLDYALNEVANKAHSQRLLTEDIDGNHIVRLAFDDAYIREATLPENDEEVIDLDRGLCFAVARYIASFLSKHPSNVAKHERAAEELVMLYNGKIEAFIEKENQQGGTHEQYIRTTSY
jgi:hypothetical protein